MAVDTLADTSVKIEENVQGIILRTTATFSGRYAYISLQHASPTVVNNTSSHDDFADSLTAAPHFPDITILDSFSSIILYQTYNSSPDFFHVYDLITRSHFPIPFPSRDAFVNAAIAMHERNFKVLVVCIKEQTNPLFDEAWNRNSSDPLVFYIYSSKSEKWSSIQNPFASITSNHLLPNSRKPAHASEDVVYLDLSGYFLIRFAALEDLFEAVPKLVSPWERDSLDITTRYAGCRGWLHCAKFNPHKSRLEVFVWTMEPPKGVWRFVAAEKDGCLRGTVLGLHPCNETLVFMRSEANDEILMIDIVESVQSVVISGRGPKCSQVCFLKGMTDVLEAALEGGEKLQHSDCDILHPHENVEGPQGEIFFVSLFS